MLVTERLVDRVTSEVTPDWKNRRCFLIFKRFLARMDERSVSSRQTDQCPAGQSRWLSGRERRDDRRMAGDGQRGSAPAARAKSEEGPMTSGQDHLPDFENHQEAFKDRSTWEICKSLTILRLCGVEALAKNSLKISAVSRLFLGKRIHEKLLKRTFYGHFVAGDCEEMIDKTLTELRSKGIRAMIACPNEEDVGETGQCETKYESCIERMLECIRLAAAFGHDSPKTQIKVTGAMQVDLLLKLGASRSLEDTVALVRAVSQRLQGGPLKIEDGSGLRLTEEEFGQLDRGIARLKVVGESAFDHRVSILVDAEYVSVNAAISVLTLAMMDAFNRRESIVWSTFQCYLKAAHDNVQRELTVADRLGVRFAAKVVRGAYLTAERSRARLDQRPDPTNETYEATNAMYDRVVSFFIDFIVRNPKKCEIVVATHNENSVRLALQKLKIAGISANDDSITFAQLYGMCDQITYPLAQRGYGVYKSMPFGTVEDVMPYLHRRAMENVDVLKGSRKEVQLLKAEVRHRLRKAFGLTG